MLTVAVFIVMEVSDLMPSSAEPMVIAPLLITTAPSLFTAFASA